MATVSKFNSDVLVDGTLYSTGQHNLFALEFGSALTEDSGGSGSAITEGTFRKVAQELGSHAMLFELHDDDKSTMIIIGDGHAVDIDAIARRADLIVGGSGVLTGSGTTALVTVTAPGTTRGL